MLRGEIKQNIFESVTIFGKYERNFSSYVTLKIVDKVWVFIMLYEKMQFFVKT